MNSWECLRLCLAMLNTIIRYRVRKVSIRPGQDHPQSNGMAEAFVKTFKRDYVYVNDFKSADELRAKLAE